MNARLILSLLLGALVALFILQNMTVVEVRFLVWSVVMSRALLMVLVLTIGIALGALLHSYLMHRRRSGVWR